MATWILFLIKTLTCLTLTQCANIVFLSDTSFSQSDTYIDKELLPIFNNLPIDYIVLTGAISDDFSSATSAKLISRLTPYAKAVYWIPGDADFSAIGTTTNFTRTDMNLHNTFVNPAHGLYFTGIGGTYVDSASVDGLISGMNLESNSSVILLTYDGPYGFDTTVVRSSDPASIDAYALPSAQWMDTGNRNLTNFLSQSVAQSNVILHVHGNNPSGMGAARFGGVQIINAGSAKDTKSFAWVEVTLNSPNGWLVNSWKFYRFGNVTSWGGATSFSDGCKITTNTIPAPYSDNDLSRAAIAMFSIFLAAYILGFLIFLTTGPVK